ncbi:MAG: GntR family transcriptional regulator [Oscillospiraceae bacterium]|nr:GntR family transcriptional regulator [Oscillospiraceae bacterium]
MTEFKSISLATQVFEKLEEDIITGVYPQGEILTELRLVEQLGVSRTPIREALRRLEQERLIAESGKGSVVLGITLEDLVDLMDIRERIEGLAAYHATKNLTDAGREELQHISELQDFYFAKQDIDNLRKMDDKFHDTIYNLTGRPVLRDALIPLHRKSQRYRKISIEDKDRLGKSIQEHKAICNAILSGDADLAAELITAHIQHAKKNMIERCYRHG